MDFGDRTLASKIETFESVCWDQSETCTNLLNWIFGMKKNIFQFALILAFAVSFLVLTPEQKVRATSTVTRYVGDVEGVALTVINGPPNSTGYYNITESNPGLIVYSLTQNGTYSNSLILPFTLDANGNSSTLHYYDKAVAPVNNHAQKQEAGSEGIRTSIVVSRQSVLPYESLSVMVLLHNETVENKRLVASWCGRVVLDMDNQQ